MLKAIEPIYNTLYQAILNSTYAPDQYLVQIKDDEGNITQPGIIQTFDRGFWYKGEECVHQVEMFPYGFLDEPYWDEIENESFPMCFVYQIHIEMIILTMATDGDRKALFFPETEGQAPHPQAAMELLLDIANDIREKYAHGLPFAPTPTPGTWNLQRWWTGAGGRPFRYQRDNRRELDHYFQNPNIAGASVIFVFEVHENGPMPLRQ